MQRLINKFLSVVGFSVLLSTLAIATEPDRPAVISLIIDDIGNSPESGLAALELPGDLVYSVLPNTPYATLLAEIAHEKGKQVMLHIPMEAEHHKELGPNGLLLNMTEPDYKAVLNHALQSVPHAVGMNNHMGSLLTQHQQPMEWLMDVLLERQLFFLDSRTTVKTVAQQTAVDMGVKTFRRDVFLDNSRNQEDILEQFNRLISLARRKGYATGIAHPYPETLAVLKEQIPALQAKGVKLVFASEFLDQYTPKDQELTQRNALWPVSSSPSHKVAKN